MLEGEGGEGSRSVRTEQLRERAQEIADSAETLLEQQMEGCVYFLEGAEQCATSASSRRSRRVSAAAGDVLARARRDDLHSRASRFAPWPSMSRRCCGSICSARKSA